LTPALAKRLRKPAHFHAHETARMDALDGLPLARFWPRGLGFGTGFFLMLFLWNRCTQLWMLHVSHTWDGHTPLRFVFSRESLDSIVGLVLYFSLATWLGKGRTPGKWIARTRVVSLTHGSVGIWQSVQRALGYGASFLEGGFSFAQYFIARNRMRVHDPIADTIVVDLRKMAKRLTDVDAEYADS
jgi:hypothetical protein